MKFSNENVPWEEYECAFAVVKFTSIPEEPFYSYELIEGDSMHDVQIRYRDDYPIYGPEFHIFLTKANCSSGSSNTID